MVLGAAGLWRSPWASPFPLAHTVPYGVNLDGSAASPFSQGAVAGPVPIQFTLQRGETLGTVLAELDLSNDEIREVVDLAAQHADLRRLRAGDPYSVDLDPNSELAGLTLRLREKGRLGLIREKGEWRAEIRPFQVHTQTRVIRGDLTGSLDASLTNAGGDPRLSLAMSDVLQWDLDFNRDLRIGDRFEMTYDVRYVDGARTGLSTIRALGYENRGVWIEAYRFGGGYYDADGRPLRKMFLRSPLPYSRVTSRFSTRRFHPVLKTYRAHYGVDYGAPAGTAVRVTANGVVASAAWDDGGGGRTVKVRHSNSYLTAYLHLSKFATGIRGGQRIRQGDTIGYVGSSGMATGPHLDYRVQRSGKWINPMSLENSPAEPIPGEQMTDFLRVRDEYRLSFGESSLLATAYQSARVDDPQAGPRTTASAGGR